MKPPHPEFTTISLLVCIAAFNVCSINSFQMSWIPARIAKVESKKSHFQSNLLLCAVNDSATTKDKGKGKSKGVYVRPSAAIERGSGFYVPGLEGYRVRIIFGALCLILSYINSALGLGDSNISAVEFSQKLVGFYGVLLLFQGLVEFGKEAGLGLDFEVDKSGLNVDTESSSSSTSGSSKSKSLDQVVAGGLEEKLLEKIQWVAASFVALTPAVQVMFLECDDDGNREVLYSLGSLSFQKSDDDLNQAIDAAVDTVFNSKGGRVSVPDTHPCATLLPEESRRCILLQKVDLNIDDSNMGKRDRRYCLMVGSNQLLAAFTKNDLKWLGSLANSLS